MKHDDEARKSPDEDDLKDAEFHALMKAGYEAIVSKASSPRMVLAVCTAMQLTTIFAGWEGDQQNEAFETLVDKLKLSFKSSKEVHDAMKAAGLLARPGSAKVGKG